mmetsp:Transcript_75607/g.194841  ORF Transcript_75607/g.194841 Transcript_75607/m.194841 type:complete len:206 (+) Transcript_75607:567-1184(+)
MVAGAGPVEISKDADASQESACALSSFATSVPPVRLAAVVVDGTSAAKVVAASFECPSVLERMAALMPRLPPSAPSPGSCGSSPLSSSHELSCAAAASAFSDAAEASPSLATSPTPLPPAAGTSPTGRRRTAEMEMASSSCHPVPSKTCQGLFRWSGLAPPASTLMMKPLAHLKLFCFSLAPPIVHVSSMLKYSQRSAPSFIHNG